MSNTDTNVLEPTRLLGTLVVENIPETSEKIFRLPGGVSRADNVLSGKQLRTLVGYLHEHFSPDTTLIEAFDGLRREAKLTVHQLDFTMVEFVIRQARTRDAALDITPAQLELLSTCVSALTGIARHWDADIQRKIDAVPANRREQIVQIFNNAVMDGRRLAVDRAMVVFRTNFGDPKSAAQRAGDVLGLDAELNLDTAVDASKF